MPSAHQCGGDNDVECGWRESTLLGTETTTVRTPDLRNEWLWRARSATGVLWLADSDDTVDTESQLQYIIVQPVTLQAVLPIFPRNPCTREYPWTKTKPIEGRKLNPKRELRRAICERFALQTCFKTTKRS